MASITTVRAASLALCAVEVESNDGCHGAYGLGVVAWNRNCTHSRMPPTNTLRLVRLCKVGISIVVCDVFAPVRGIGECAAAVTA